MATSGIPQLSKTWDNSSFSTHSFDYQWTIQEINSLLTLNKSLDSPLFKPDFKLSWLNYKTAWKMTFAINHDNGTKLSLMLTVYYNQEFNRSLRSTKPGANIGLHAGIKFCVIQPCQAEGAVPEVEEQLHRELNIQYLPWNYKTSPPFIYTVNIPYETPVGVDTFADCNANFIKNATYNNTLTLYCKVDIYMLDAPHHETVTPLAQTIKEQKFNLGETMEEARKNDLFTDVTLVSGDKEFKAHRAVLASQSPFFKTRFQEHWERNDNKVEMGDLTPDILEAMLSFMYTGKVVAASQLTAQLLPAAEEYRLVGLRQICEKVLSESLNAQNVIENVILADTHNADQLKSACMSYITKNPSDVQKSEGWKVLKDTKERNELRIEIMEAIVESLVR